MLSRGILISLCMTSFASVASAGGGEVIVIDERPARPAVFPKPKNYSSTKTPPYSDRAIESDAWTRAWLLLEIDRSGAVTRFKFINRPGYDLEGIAAHEVFKLRFTPARDAAGRKVRSWVIWLIEWPSHGWLNARMGITTRMPPIVGFPPRSMASAVRCKGSGPLSMDSIYPVYRDCSRPDLKKSFDAEPWYMSPW